MTFAALYILLFSTAVGSHQSSFLRTYECKNHQCQRTNQPLSIIDPVQLKIHQQHTTLAACRLVCGTNGGLWPLPSGNFIIGKNYISTHPNEINFNVENIPVATRLFITEVHKIFFTNLRWICGNDCVRVNSSVIVDIKIHSQRLELDWSTREDYTLKINAKDTRLINVSIMAFTVYGARHALETLSQLIVPIMKTSNTRGLAIIDSADIEDKPIFKHRGLLIDTSRNFLPLSSILRTIDGLAATKMNVLHWHATDSQSFPLYIKKRPLMSWYGAYSSKMIYSSEDLERIKNYAKYRGVQVIIEFDSPGHAGAGWEWGKSEGLGNLAVCVNREPWRDYCVQPPCGQLNPVNPNVFHVLEDIYSDTLAVFGNNSIIHLGGDEVFLPCWNTTEEIVNVMASRGLGRTADDFFTLWSEFHVKQLKIIDELRGNKQDTTVILWSSGLTVPNIIEKYLDKNRFVIQTWLEAVSSYPEELLSRGYRIIISTKDAWYLDHGFWGTTKYHSWRNVYNNKLPRRDGVLGGEVCMWGEYVNEGSLDARVWPRTAAAGERLWTDSSTLTTADVEPRLQAQRERLESRQVYTDSITPAWCAQHATKCF